MDVYYWISDFINHQAGHWKSCLINFDLSEPLKRICLIEEEENEKPEENDEK